MPTLLKAISKAEREAMTADEMFEMLVAQIQSVQGPIVIRTRYESSDKSTDLWLHVSPIMIQKGQSDAMAEGEQLVAQKPGVIH